MIEGWLDELRTAVAEQFDQHEIVLVDDRSTDSTPRLLDDYARRFPSVRVEHAPANQGHGPTLRRALDLSSGDWIFHVDSDRQFIADDFWALWERRAEADIVLGVRTARRDPPHRLALSVVVNASVRILGGHRVRDANSPFRLYRRAFWNEMAPHVRPDTLAPSIFLVLAAARRGGRIRQVPIRHLPREHAPSTLSLLRLIRFSTKGLVQLVRFRTTLRGRHS